MRTTQIVVFAVAAAVLAVVGAQVGYWVIWAAIVVLATVLWIVRR
ncbi:hypothetical protein [Nocardia rhizosphaerihabitans]|uniref:Uncharacterized protein n=1 Tax=Nocardia rhizosphaerihabitans TaxID=1691570 RepID=A0ABQ2K2Q3_9NOCA|nr:hypothetical protein [Nocardia rhizosphaerihabitans]GGN66364.1 hypothetical protein GCM10011610_01270 [Nocardia rhizosphaerihabitans]